MPGQHRDQPAVLVGIGIGGEALLVLAFLKRAEKGIRRLGVTFQSFMDRVVVGVEDFKAALEPRLRLGKDRKIMMVLDIVMTIEISKKMIETRCEPAREIGCRQPAFAIVANAVGEHAAELAEHVVPLQPHIGDAVNVGMAPPGFAWIFLGQPAQVIRQAFAFEKQGFCKFGHDGFLSHDPET